MFTFEEHRAQGQAGIKEILTVSLISTTIIFTYNKSLLKIC